MLMLLDQIDSPADLRRLSYAQLDQLAQEVRQFIVEAVAANAGHLGSNLGVVELTFAIHRVFDSPRDVVLWDTGHQAYVHKIVTGRRDQFTHLRQEGGLSGYPNRAESEHDWVENSHASTILSYAHGLATAFGRSNPQRKIVAVVGDGSMTGGMMYEALNNLGHSERRVVIILNDNGRSYAPTISKLSESVTRLRASPSYVNLSTKIEGALRELPGVGRYAEAGFQGLKAAAREVMVPTTFFEALGVRYIGPIDGHDVEGMEDALRKAAAYDGPIIVHVLTQKGRGYPPAEDDDEKCLHDAVVFDIKEGPPSSVPLRGYTQAFSEAMIAAAERSPQVMAITAAMPGPTGLLPFQSHFPDRFLDVGIAEQHAVTAAAGMAMGGLRPVVAVYSTFFSRAFDQANLDVGMHHLPVVFALDRAGITGPDGASHHGVLDLALCLAIPGMTMFAPSSAEELTVMLDTALELDGPASIRFPRAVPRSPSRPEVGSGLHARKARTGTDLCILAVGKMFDAAEDAAVTLGAEGIAATVWDVRVVKPLDPAMILDAAAHPVVITVEDGIRVGGAGTAIADAITALDPGRPSPPVVKLGTPSEYIPHGEADAILARLGLDAVGVANTAREAVAATRLTVP